MTFKWFYLDVATNKGRVFITDGFIPKNVDQLIDITTTNFTAEDGPILSIVNGVVQIDPIKKAALDQVKADKALADSNRLAAEKTIVEQLKLAATVIDNSSLETPIKTLLKRMVKLLARDL